MVMIQVERNTPFISCIHHFWLMGWATECPLSPSLAEKYSRWWQHSVRSMSPSGVGLALLHQGTLPMTSYLGRRRGVSLLQRCLSVQFSRSVMSDSMWPHGPQNTRPSCPSLTLGVYSNSCPSSQWCHPAISSSVVHFSSCPQSLPASGSFPMGQFFAYHMKHTLITVGCTVSIFLLFLCQFVFLS